MTSLAPKQIPLHLIDDPLTAGGRLDPQDPDLESLAASIRDNTLLQCPGLCATGDGRYAVIFGRRRLRAVALLHWTTCPCYVAPGDDGTLIQAAWAENFDRRNLTPLEEATILAIAADAGTGTDEIASRVHHTRDWVEDRIALLQLPPEIRDAIQVKAIPLAVATVLAKVEPPDTQNWLLTQAIANGCTAKTARLWHSMYSGLHSHPDLPAPPVQTRDRDPSDPEPGLLSPVTVSRTCPTCTNTFRPDAMLAVYLCPNCFRAFRDTLAPLQPEHPTT